MTDENQPGRRRGGQPGNRNAVKHGYYARVFTREDNADLRSAADVTGLDEEIALVRHVIKKAAASPDDHSMLVLIRAANVLNRLVRTRYKMEGSADQLGQAVANVRRSFEDILPLPASFPPNESGK